MATKNKKTFLNTIFIFFLLTGLFCGCVVYHKSLDTKDLKSTEKLLIFKGTQNNKYFVLSNGQEISMFSSIFQNLFDWFEKKKDGWKKLPKNYASIDLVMPDLVVKNDKFKLSFYNTFTILEYKDSKGKIRIISKDIENNEFDFLNRLY
jgi:hypothetical protein